MNLYWTGARASDTRYTDAIFSGSITIYGNNEGGNVSYCFGRKRINHNVFCQESSGFILKKQLELIERQPECLFMAYNPNYVYGAPKAIIDRTICLNDERLMRRLDNKIEFRGIAKSVARTLDCDVLSGSELALCAQLRSSVLEGARFVVQLPVSSGGEGTYLIDASSIGLLSELGDADVFQVSRYIEDNIPINAHCVIFDDGSLMLPPSVQIVSVEGSKLLYRGADYISYKDVPDWAKAEFARQLELLCEELRLLGYRGVIGFDGIVCHGGVYIVEANNRFQGSTYALNRALCRSGLPSVQRLNLEAFGLAGLLGPPAAGRAGLLAGFSEPAAEGRSGSPAGLLGPPAAGRSGSPFARFASVDVPYSYYCFTNDFGGLHARHVMGNSYRSDLIVEHSSDGFDAALPAEDNAYLYHLLFRASICSIDEASSKATLHPALLSPSEEWHGRILDGKDIGAIRIALINQGVAVSEEAKRHLAWEHRLCEGSYISLDLLLENRYFANCPVSSKFAGISPFALHCDDGGRLSVSYYGSALLEGVKIVPKAVLERGLASSGKQLRDIAFFSTDRLRLQNSPSCVFNKPKQACRFCEVCGWDLDFSKNDIMEAIDICFSLRPLPFRHILIGGRSNAIGSERQTILDMCARIKSHADVPIYLMCLPPRDLSDIKEYYEAGVTEFGFNIEVFDRDVAKRIMPGKGRIPVGQYLDALSYAAGLCGRDGSVRSAFIVGMEPAKSLLEGVEAVCKVGAAPILSAFRPVRGTPMQDIAPLSSAELMRVTCAAEELCGRYGLSLGPQCPACQNNTLNTI